jgi:hypothetical protein
MQKIIVAASLFLLLIWPSGASAADRSVNLRFCLQDGMASTELWYKDQVVWRLVLLSDDARPVAGFYDDKTIYLAPYVNNGLFTIKLQ